MEDQNWHIIGKILDRFGIVVNGFNRWGEDTID
jgi:3-polyprenyl-4-hydroxybenzoate decarboxylase